MAKLLLLLPLTGVKMRSMKKSGGRRRMAAKAKSRSCTYRRLTVGMVGDMNIVSRPARIRQTLLFWLSRWSSRSNRGPCNGGLLTSTFPLAPVGTGGDCTPSLQVLTLSVPSHTTCTTGRKY